MKHRFERGVFSIATGSSNYLRMAYALARSFRRWNSPDNLPFFLVTDKVSESLPMDLSWVRVVEINPGEFGAGFSPKLHLDRFAPARRSLFIDADCLCVGDLIPVFEKFAGHNVSVVGRMISDGEWFGDVRSVCSRLGVECMPRFNGGIYYLEVGDSATKTFEVARNLEADYDDIGFVRLRGFPNDEVLISAGMALNGQKPVLEDGRVMNSLLAAPAGVRIDVFAGKALLLNTASHPNHNEWYEQEVLSPLLVHFAGCPVNRSPYVDELVRLELVYERDFPVWFASVFVWIRYTIPDKLTEGLRSFLRPAYRMLFGVRKVSGGSRS